MNRKVRQIAAHIWQHRVLWLSLAFFVVFAWSVTGTSCTIRSITGLPCPGCGLTRALLLFLRGDLAGAWTMHPLFWLAPPVLAAILYLAIRDPARLSSRTATAAWISITALFVIVYLVRMALIFPDAEPLTWNDQAFIIRTARWLLAGIRSILQR
jgi:cytochrome bd-type quinol oxidase subunit 2